LGRDVAVRLEDGGTAGRLLPHLVIVLVEDLPDQLLQQVLQRDDAERAAELVQHEGEMPALPLHVEQEVPAVPAGRRDRDRSHRQRISRPELEEIECVEHADDLVEGAAEHRDPAVAALGKHHANVLQRGVLLDRDDVGARGHDLAHRAHGERHDAAHHYQLVVRPDPYRGALAPDRTKVGRPGDCSRRQKEPDHPGPEAKDRQHPIGDALRPR
jgi:hypothetical protein